MSEQKVQNKYYPLDFDPSKIPKLKLPKDQQYEAQLMVSFKETVQVYLGLPIFRFCIKCMGCLAEITFQTDPDNRLHLGASWHAELTVPKAPRGEAGAK